MTKIELVRMTYFPLVMELSLFFRVGEERVARTVVVTLSKFQVAEGWSVRVSSGLQHIGGRQDADDPVVFVSELLDTEMRRAE